MSVARRHSVIRLTTVPRKAEDHFFPAAVVKRVLAGVVRRSLSESSFLVDCAGSKVGKGGICLTHTHTPDVATVLNASPLPRVRIRIP